MAKGNGYNVWEFLSDNIGVVAFIIIMLCIYAPDIIKAFHK